MHAICAIVPVHVCLMLQMHHMPTKADGRTQIEQWSLYVPLDLITVSVPDVTVPPCEWTFPSDCSVHPAVCVRCCGREAGFHPGRLFHTERQREK